MSVDPQSIVDNLEAAILALSTDTDATVNFNGQSFTAKSLKELQEARTYWKAEVIRSRSAPDPVPRHGPRFVDA